MKRIFGAVLLLALGGAGAAGPQGLTMQISNGWSFSFSGNVNAFLVYEHEDTAVASVGGIVGNSHSGASRIRTGLLPAFAVFDAKGKEGNPHQQCRSVARHGLPGVAAREGRGAAGSTLNRIHIPAAACPGTPQIMRYDPALSATKRISSCSVEVSPSCSFSVIPWLNAAATAPVFGTGPSGITSAEWGSIPS